MQDLLKRLGITDDAPKVASYNFRRFNANFPSQMADGRAITRFSDGTILEIDMSTSALDGPPSFYAELIRGSETVSLASGNAYKSQGFDRAVSEEDKKAFAEYFDAALKHSQGPRSLWPFARKEPVDYNYACVYARSSVLSQYIRA